jgi:hypothetical protein
MPPEPWDFEIVDRLLAGSSIDIAKLEAGDVLLIRPSQDLTLSELERAAKMASQALDPHNIHAVVIPCGWDLGVARPVTPQDVVDGLHEIMAET